MKRSVLSMKKIAIIGGGVFGCSVAITLARRGFFVSLFERSNEIMSGASTNNHLRHHYGYHYPRSKETALDSIDSKKDFEEEYLDCIISGFPAYYAVAKENSKSTPEEFLKFCHDLGLKYEIVNPDPAIFDVAKISLCLKTSEPAYDPKTLKEIMESKLRENSVKLHVNHEITSGKINIDGSKELSIKNEGIIFNEKFDFVISAIYSNFNKINEWFGFKKSTFRYDLMELIDVRLPLKKRIAAMVVDGDFSTFVPLKEEGVVRLGHVKEVLLKTAVSDSLDAQELIEQNTTSNKDRILSESIKYYPILKNSKFLKSIFIVRIIKANAEGTDERPSEITSHGSGIYSIFGGKVITAMTTAKKLSNILSKK